MDARWQRVGSGGSSRDRDRSGMPAAVTNPHRGNPYGSNQGGGGGDYGANAYGGYADNGPGRENVWNSGPRGSQPQQQDQGDDGRIYFAVTFDEKDEAKSLGARWDAHRKSWYAEDAGVASMLDGRFKRR